MLRPKRMSKVSVTGSKPVMAEVIEVIHDLNLVHLVDYDGSWDGFTQGDPIQRAEKASQQLVTVRSIESILDIDEDASSGGTQAVSNDTIETELEEIRQEVNELDDQRSELRDRLREIDERITATEPFVDLGLDLDLLSGYDSLVVRVGEGDPDAVREVLNDTVAGPFEIFSGEQTIAVFARDNSESIDNALVGVEFQALEVPDAAGPPTEYIEEFEREQAQIESRLGTIENQLAELRIDAGRFILSVEQQLSIEVQKTEAPLRFATTQNAFVAEGWIPSDRFTDLESTLQSEIGDSVEIEELERAAYNRHGHATHTEEAVTDGGSEVAMSDEGPPIVQSNPDSIRPFELLVNTISRPRYSEIDPTLLVFLTFPTFFGFMIGDVGYGIFYVLVGYVLFTRFEGVGIKSLGGVAIWSGFFTIVFGILYGEFFGIPIIADLIWGGHAPMEKGLEAIDFALLWLFIVMVIGLLHVGVGYVLDFVNKIQHSFVDAVLESVSWFILMFGVWIWIFSRHLGESKPGFIFEVLNHGDGAVYALGFGGFSEGVGIAALGVAAIGFVLMMVNEWRHFGVLGLIVGPLESLTTLVNILSYARITAVLIAKAGMAFVVNLLFFGLYEHDGEAEFMISESPNHVATELGCSSVASCEQIVFPGLIHGEIAALVGGVIILIIGHAVVWSLGITSAGLQAIRLEYVEFFQKFYEGGGDPYEPFGYDRS